MTILLPIIKTFSDSIFSGSKRYEYRKGIPQKGVERVIVYESRGAGMIVGEFDVAGILEGSPEEIWNLTKEASGTSKNHFLSYFRNRDKAYALKIGDYRRYDIPKPLSDYKISRPPQNFIYLE